MWRVRAFETGCVGACFGRGPRCGGSRSWGRMGWASPLRGGFVSACVCRGWWVLHTRVHSASAGTAESCGTAPSVAATVMLPCAQTPSPHMGTQPPHTMITRKSRHSNKKQPSPRKDPALPCATPTTTTPEARTHHVSHRDRSTSGSRSVRFNSSEPTSRRARRARGRKPHAAPQNRQRTADPRKHDRSRHGLRPISTRVSTDLDAGYDRSRHGLRPISTRVSTDLDAESDRSRCLL